jgi:acyl-CoA synthetase (AMP-forming)/AMP-acid ligase II
VPPVPPTGGTPIAQPSILPDDSTIARRKDPAVDGLMQDFPLTLPHLFDRAERLFADKEVVTVTATGQERTTYGAWAERARRLGGALDALGVSDDGRVATFAWNTARHLELYFAAPCTGRVVHTLNIRLFPEQLVYIANHADDEVIFVDRSLARLLFPLVGQFTTVKHMVVMDDGTGDLPPIDTGVAVHDYETLLAAAEPVAYVVDDESRAASMCYTSGTTGNPKGVVYSHRSMVLHTLGVMAAGTLAIDEPDRVLPIVPMFHANAWGLAHAAVAAGASLILPGPDLSPAAVAGLIESERVTVAAGVPTIWMGVLPELDGRNTGSLRSIVCGGSAVPPALSEAYEARVGLPILQAWGMTETSPVGAVCRIKSTLGAAPGDGGDDGRVELRSSVGQPAVGVEARITRPDSANPVEPLPWDGVTPGELQVRGPWIAAGYHADARSAASFSADGWLRTGDIATIDAHGYIRLVDRAKDVIKSGGEWISSVELENEIMAHPQVSEAAVIGVADARWGERPVACVVLRPGAQPTGDTKVDIRAFLEPRVAKWWLPDDIVFLDHIPKTSVGKFSKKELRHLLASHHEASR